jgi:hypothetical protein
MCFLIEEGRFHNVFEDQPAKWPIAKKKTSKCTLTTNSYDFARRYGRQRYIIKLSIA